MIAFPTPKDKYKALGLQEQYGLLLHLRAHFRM